MVLSSAYQINKYYIILICNMTENLIEIKKLCLSEARDS